MQREQQGWEQQAEPAGGRDQLESPTWLGLGFALGFALGLGFRLRFGFGFGFGLGLTLTLRPGSRRRESSRAGLKLDTARLRVPPCALKSSRARHCARTLSSGHVSLRPGTSMTCSGLGLGLGLGVGLGLG